jgi:predicted hotdog family 3-hydroxylacyl-ACP dehydratase
MGTTPVPCDLIPHAGSMCLLHELISWDATGICCTALSHLDLGNPLRIDGRLAPIHAVEYASQACALHGALAGGGTAAGAGAMGRGKAARSLLAAVNQIELGPLFLDAIHGPLSINAWRELASRGGAIYRFAVEGDGRTLARGRLTVLLAEPGS